MPLSNLHIADFDTWLDHLCGEGSVKARYHNAKNQVERWGAIRGYYAYLDPQIDTCPADEWAVEPSGFSLNLHFTPIERIAWEMIREHRVVAYPQYPACGYFLDFANPKAKFAIEMDGKQWHDPARDAIRDARLIFNDWTVYRIKGAECYLEMPDLSALYESFEGDTENEEYQEAIFNWYSKTVEGVILAIGMNHVFPDRYDYKNAEAVNASLRLHRSVLSGRTW